MALKIIKPSILSTITQQLQKIHIKGYCSKMTGKYETLDVTVPKEFVYMVQLNRPKKLNSMNNAMWREFRECFTQLAVEPECRAIVLSGSGRMFCAGLDFEDAMKMAPELQQHDDIARRCKVLRSKIKAYQDSFTSIEKCPKPVIAAVHNACIGAGIDMISAADIRYCTEDAWFQIKEVGIGMAADVGTLQRFPKVVGSDSLARELVYTARKFTAAEAQQCGFVSCVLNNQESLMKKAMEVAELIASKSPVAVQTSKMSLVYSRDHPVSDGLEHIRLHNQAMLQSEDFINATMAEAMKGDPPIFSKL